MRAFLLGLALTPHIITIGLMIYTIGYLEINTKQEDTADKIATKLMNIILCFIIAFYVWSLLYIRNW